jgi:hypothetical protein
MELQFKKAVRKAVPMLISVSSVSGGGKTYTALLVAAGIAGPTGRVGFIDTENGRGAMYADSPGIVKALPNGYEIVQLDPPFSPERYVEAIAAAERAGINVLIVDSISHEWEGIGGCVEIAEKNKLRGMPNWSKAKMAHKRFMNHCLSTSMHLIFCIRARDKVKIVEVEKDGRKTQEVVPIGLQPITEKNLVFEALLSLMLDEKTHHATPVKVPEPLAHLFSGAKLVTKEDGERIRQWNSAGAIADPHEQIQKRARAAAEEGMASYTAFYGGLAPAQKKIIFDTTHADNKRIAEVADQESASAEDANGQPAARNLGILDRLPDAMDHPAGTRATTQGVERQVIDTENGPKWVPVAGAAA